MSLRPVLSPTPLEASQVFLSSLYDKAVMDKDEDEVYRCRSLRFLVGNECLTIHLVIMRHYCSKLKEVLDGCVKNEEGAVGLASQVTLIADELGVSPEAFKMFRKAIYMKEFDPPTFDILVQVRRLAEKFGCWMVLEKCDGVQISMEDCHVVFDKWPEGSEVQTKALNFVKGNLKTLVETERSLDWSQVLWQTILSLNDLLAPVPSEDELFKAALNWQHKHRTAVDKGKFRLSFRDLFRYPLMTEHFLISTVRESGILEHFEIFEIWDETQRRGFTKFNKTPRTATTGLPFAAPSQGASEGPTPTTSTSFSTTAVQQADTSGAVGSSLMETETNQAPSTSLQQRIVVSSKDKGAEIEGENGNTDSKRKRCNSPELIDKRKSSQTQVSTETNSPATNAFSLHSTRSQNKKRVSYALKGVASTFVELQVILENATVGEQIELTAGTFNGHIRLDDLPEGVRIFGAGKGQTIIKATRKETHIWMIKAGKGCTFQDLKFESSGPDREGCREAGLKITGSGVKIHNVDFDGCYLRLLGCVGADVLDVGVKNSSFGVRLDKKTRNSHVKNVALNKVETGIEVSGRKNRISGVQCVGVDVGVFFSGTIQNASLENTLTDLTYTFSKEPVTSDRVSQQSGVKMNYSKSNVVENVRCLEYDSDSVNYGTKPLDNEKHVGACAIWIQHTGRAGGSDPNKLKGISGGPIWVGGEGNVIEDVTDCPFLQARGRQHQFINCVVGKADTKQAKEAVYDPTCNFNATSCEKAPWVSESVSIK